MKGLRLGKSLVGGAVAIILLTGAVSALRGAIAAPDVAMLTVANETNYTVEVRVEGSTMCHMFNLYPFEIGEPVTVEHNGIVLVGGFARGEFGSLEGYWPMAEYRPPRTGGMSELTVKLTPAEMLPPD